MSMSEAQRRELETLLLALEKEVESETRSAYEDSTLSPSQEPYQVEAAHLRVTAFADSLTEPEGLTARVNDFLDKKLPAIGVYPKAEALTEGQRRVIAREVANQFKPRISDAAEEVLSLWNDPSKPRISTIACRAAEAAMLAILNGDK